MKILCRVLGHRVNRKRIRRSGHTYHGRCKWCDTRMERRPDGWIPQVEREGWSQDAAADA